MKQSAKQKCVVIRVGKQLKQTARGKKAFIIFQFDLRYAYVTLWIAIDAFSPFPPSLGI